MSAVSGFVVGVLALSALEAVSSSSFASGSIGDGLTAAANVVRRWSDPEVPAIPDLRSRISLRTPIPKQDPGGGVTGGGGGGQGGGGSWASYKPGAFSNPNQLADVST